MNRVQRTATLAIAALFAAALTPGWSQQDCQPTGSSAELTAGQHFDAGQVVVSADGGQICVTFQTQDDWRLAVTHLAFGLSLADIPQTKKGNPRPGQFAYSTTHSTPVSEYSYCVPFANPGNEPVYVAAHAEVVRIDEVGGSVVQAETAWAGDQDFPGANWATYFVFTPGCIFND